MTDFTIFYPTPPEEVEDIRNDNLDVCIDLADGSHYTIVCATPANLCELMREEGVHYVDPAFRMIVVERLDRPTIEAVVRELMKRPALLALYGSDPAN